MERVQTQNDLLESETIRPNCVVKQRPRRARSTAQSKSDYRTSRANTNDMWWCTLRAATSTSDGQSLENREQGKKRKLKRVKGTKETVYIKSVGCEDDDTPRALSPFQRFFAALSFPSASSRNQEQSHRYGRITSKYRRHIR